MFRISTLLAVLLLLSIKSSFAQNSETPNIVADHVIDQKYTLDAIFRFQIPVPLGGGVAASYYIPNLIHVQGEAGIGWTYVTKPKETGNPLFTTWLNAYVGYPLHITKAQNTKFTISRSSEEVAKGRLISETFFTIKAPNHYMLIPEIGFVVNPRGHYLAPAGALGVSIRRMVNADVKVLETGGKIHEGRVRRYTYFSGGILMPLKEEILLDDGSTIPKSDIASIYMKFGIYYFGATWELGLSSFGYGNEALLLFGAKFPIH